ncbi:MAG TPA: helix-turn-helix domain-containing protein [Paraburkholderia sp.]
MFRTLVKVGPEGLSADQLATFVDSPASLSSHLDPLLNAKLVSRRGHGRYIVYAARYDEINDLLAYLLGHC